MKGYEEQMNECDEYKRLRRANEEIQGEFQEIRIENKGRRGANEKIWRIHEGMII
jgi:hypothetical protein